jgi:uncharacterized membrane protein YhaH (DUF805 family)
MNWYLGVLKKYAVFGGRARRKEYWFFVLFNVIISIAIGIVGGLTGAGLLGGVYTLAMLVPSIAVGVRRLHDSGRPGWWLLVAVVPLLGLIALFVLMVQDSEPGENQYGPNPKETSA